MKPPPEFEADCKNPNNWVSSANALLISAQAVWDKAHVLRGEITSPHSEEFSIKFREQFKVMLNSMYFYSMALECCLKGYLSKCFPEKFKIIKKEKNGEVYADFVGIIGSQKNSHNLYSLAEACDYLKELTPKEIGVLKYGTHLIQWLGRYHTPNKSNLDTSRVEELDMMDESFSFPQIIEPMIFSIIERIKSEQGTGEEL